MDRYESILDGLQRDNGTVTLTRVIGGNVIGDSEKYRIDYRIEGYGMGQINYPRTTEKFKEALERFIELRDIILTKTSF